MGEHDHLGAHGPTNESGKNMSQGMSIDAFLKHSTKGTGRRNFLKQWSKFEKNPSLAIVVWLSMRTGIWPLWRHGWTRLVPREDKQTGNKWVEVWSDDLGCYEHEDVLKSQHFRDKQTGERDVPPQICPHCLLEEDVRRRIARGEIKWTQPLFRFQGTDPRQTKTIHAGGLVNMFGNKKLAQEQKAEMAAIPPSDGGPVYPGDAFKQTSIAKLKYGFCVVDNDEPQKGLQVTIESNLLGAKVQSCIAHAIKSLDDGTGNGVGERLGNPLVTPYAIRWEHNPSKDVSFDKMYDAIRMEKIRLRPEIEKLIRDTDPPDMSALAEKFNLESHRANLERHCLVKLPFDEYFAAARAMKKNEQQKAPDRVPDVGASVLAPPTPAPAPQQPPPEEEIFGCDDCGAPMKARDTKCGKCGKVYVVEAAAPPPPPPPKPLPKRSSAVAQTASTPSAPPPQQAPAGDPPEDDIPF